MSSSSARTIGLRVTLPADVAAQAEDVARSDPDFLSRVVLYGLTRRSIYRHLHDANKRERGILAEATEHERRILAENDAEPWHPGGAL